MVAIDSSLRGVVRAGVLRLEGIVLPEDGGETLWRLLADEARAIENKWSGVPVSDIPGVQEARTLYRSVGIDPTKTRPSSEALLRRTVKGKGLFRVHPLVDLFNLVSLTELLPVGLYDESKIAGDTVLVRIGDEGWGFDGIRKDRVNVEKRLCVADEKGPFGSPTSDSLRCAIVGQVDKALAIFFESASGEKARLERALEKAKNLSKTYLRAEARQKEIIE